jgi:Uma2 family endonuclease
MPTTLNDLTALNHTDAHGNRHETGPDGVLSVTPLPDGGHAKIASRLMAWLLTAFAVEQVLQAAGIQITGPQGVGGRIPDLTVWASEPPDAVWLPTDDLCLIIEIISPGSEAVDRVIKLEEYAAAGIPQYWTVARDEPQTVTLHVLGDAKTYEVAAKMPLAWLLNTRPEDHHIGA